MRDSRHESSLPNELVHSVKVISVVTTPDLLKSGVICAFIIITCEITFGAHMTHDGTVDHSKIKSV